MLLMCMVCRQYGQLLAADMAVVIQEMVNAECAGVMFTREPLAGHPSVIAISSNNGLGEVRIVEHFKLL